MDDARRLGRAMIGGCLGLAVSLIVVACAVNAPEVDALRKPPPPVAGPPPWAESVRSIAVERYSERLEEDESGTPVVTILFDEEGLVEQTSFEISDQRPRPFPPPDHFDRFGLTPDQIRDDVHFFISPIDQQSDGADSERRFMAIYFYDPGERVTGERALPDTRVVDRMIAETIFPDVFENPPSPDAALWVLFDSDGNLIRAGRKIVGVDRSANQPPDSVNQPSIQEVREHLTAEFPDITIQRVVASEITDRDFNVVTDSSGEPLPLTSMWLHPASPLPR